ncbi:hypothetical protein K9B35_09960 [Sphingomonas sp. R647]|uniref:hypothetical protein n=1 Tax=Sphingomonas sp. R647 TaxID=2875233 RepID=UPI001CD719C8|nr:hypothetical protein [Sphingomonas sp. R647]MCA1198292.1 hypothetical protein [Sphingomonas sp. R647]
MDSGSFKRLGALLCLSLLIIPATFHAFDADAQSRKKKSRSAPRKAAAPVFTEAVPPAVTGPSSASVFAPQNDPKARMIAQPYGKSNSFEIKLAAGEDVEVEIASPEGSVQTSVCYSPDNFIAGFWGSSEAVCVGPTQIDRSAGRYRFTARGKAEVRVKVNRTQGDAAKTYTIRTRSTVKGRGTDMIAMFERMADRSYIRAGEADGLPVKAIIDYRIETRGVSGVMRYRDEAGVTAETRLQLTDGGDLAWTIGDKTGLVQPDNNGALNIYSSGGGSIAYAFSVGGLITRSTYPRLVRLHEKAAEDTGGFGTGESQPLGPISAARAAALLRAGPQTLAAARAERLAQWGLLARMAGRSFGFPAPNGTERVSQWKWTETGKTMSAVFWDGNRFETNARTTLELRHDATTGAIVGTYRQPDGTATNTRFVRRPDGGIEESWNGGSGTMTATPTGVAYLDKGAAQPRPYRLLAEPDLAAFRDRTRRYQEQLAAQAAAQKESGGGGGLLKGLIGAAVGGYAASVSGADASQTVGLMMKGAAATTGDSALNAAADGFLGSSGGTSGVPGVPGAAGAPGGARASYPTQPNLATGTCAGFTEGNYRQRALRGGKDTQLDTMCGQAFEYYVAYKRAIAQGAAQADAERTYGAHRVAADNAANFLKNWAAD